MQFAPQGDRVPPTDCIALRALSFRQRGVYRVARGGRTEEGREPVGRHGNPHQRSDRVRGRPTEDAGGSGRTACTGPWPRQAAGGLGRSAGPRETPRMGGKPAVWDAPGNASLPRAALRGSGGSRAWAPSRMAEAEPCPETTCIHQRKRGRGSAGRHSWHGPCIVKQSHHCGETRTGPHAGPEGVCKPRIPRPAAWTRIRWLPRTNSAPRLPAVASGFRSSEVPEVVCRLAQAHGQQRQEQDRLDEQAAQQLHGVSAS